MQIKQAFGLGMSSLANIGDMLRLFYTLYCQVLVLQKVQYRPPK